MGCTEKQRPASAVGAKTARPCDGCLRRRARWFCEADDAFLCQVCDVSVHSANPLARRHRRVRLKTASFSGFLSTTEDGLGDHATPAWLHGCKRKPRTPRGKPGVAGAPTAAKVEPLVPDLEALSAEENQFNEEDQLLHCVPILDPVLAELLSQPHQDHANGSDTEAKPAVQLLEQAHVSAVPTADGLGGFHASDLELEQFASDMEVLLGSGLDNDSFCIDGLGWMNGTVEDDSDGQVKVEVDLDVAGTSSNFRMEMDLPKGALDLGFDSQMMAVEVDEHKPLQQAETASNNYRAEAAAKRKMILRLDYEAVIAACSSNVLSLWIDGVRPDFDPNDSWPDVPAMAGGAAAMKEMHYQQEVAHAADEGREARVSRYREKRRRRLFSKKIRYEVRKLNAEKRPRMKGRFVKRPAFPAAVACR
ncbi:zinc finger protein CONSTANS-LIKE 16-like [Musa acuminata AAA Group]|uniref:zinc finger protein CONSTANS-LIKE 16-like n=1 Tax=Musa acuminata AAA Group TaxID=214697 RepID=UPI0031CF5AF6